MSRKTIWLIIHSLLTACAVPRPAGAEDSSLKAVASELERAFGSGKGTAIMKGAKTFKKAGLSFQEELMAPQQGVVDCKNQQQLRVLAGIYRADFGYAAMFGKKDKAVTTAAFILEEVVERLDVRRKVTHDATYRDAVKNLLEDLGNEEKLGTYFDAVDQTMDTLIQKSKTDPEVAVYLLDGFYGRALEFGHLACKLGLGAPSSEKLGELFDRLAGRFEALAPILKAAQDPQLRASLEAKERLELLDAVVGRVRGKKGPPDTEDLRFILSRIEPVRESYLGRCP